jgi:ADP-heptose:LPS heptosyltransferase
LAPAAIILGFLLRRKHGIEQPPSTILFIKLMGLGSLVSSSNSIMHIRSKYPEARLVLLSDENIIEGIKPFGLFDQFLAIKSGNILQTAGSAVNILFKSWRMPRLWVVDLEVYSKLTTVYSLLTTAPNRFGFLLRPVFFRKFLNTHNVFFNQFTNLHDNYLQMAGVVTGFSIPGDTNVPKRSNEIRMPFILVNNTCSELALVRKMNIDQVMNVCKWVLDNTSYHLAFAGTTSDRSANAGIIAQLPFPGRAINLAGTYTFDAYYSFMEKQCAFIVSIDSAPLHIAMRLGVPTISVWGPTNPSFYLKIPDGLKGRHLTCYNNVACSPCVHHFEKLPCSGNNFCIRDISAETIISKIRQLLVELDFSQRIEADSPVLI